MFWMRMYHTISEVIKNKGSVSITELEKKLIEIDPVSFRPGIVRKIVNELVDCLTIEGNNILYNRNAKRYTKSGLGTVERSIQEGLHKTIPDMTEWQLYPNLTRKNSERCYMGIPWEEIPEYGLNHCDFRVSGEDCCFAGCEVEQAVLEDYAVQDKEKDETNKPKFTKTS